jgi:hypothetical protein
MTTIKITELANIGANLATSTVVPVVNMVGTPTTQKTTVGAIANLILEGAGVDYPEATVALLAQTVSNAAQPNITSVGTLTNVVVSGNASINGNITSNGTAYLGNISTTGIASITTLAVGTTANLGAVGNVTITGGTAGQVLSTNGNGVLSWASDATSYGNSNVANYLPTFTGNIGANVVTANLFSGNGTNLTNIAGANVSGFVPNANVANTAFAVAAANVSGLGNIATTNYDGNASNVLHGDGTWSADTTTYGNSNVVTLLSAFGSNTITTTGNVSVGNITATNLGNIVSANLDGNVSNLLTGNGTYVAIPVVPTVGNIATINLDGNSQTWLAGNGVFANIAIPSVGNIATLNLDGNASNVLRGDGTFSADANSSYGDSNVVTLLSAFGSNTIVTTGIITADGANLSNVPYANLTNAPSLGNIATLNLDGNVSNLLTGNGTYVAIPVVPTVGNIATINLDGSNTNVLYGNGVFAPVSGAGGLPLANGNSNFNIATANGNATVGVAGEYTWTFGTTGNVTIPGSIIGTTTIEIDNRATGNSADINLYSADDILIQARDRDAGSTAEGGDINIFAGDSAEDSDTSAGDIVIEAGRGGASNLDSGGDGGFIRIEAGRGGNAVGANFAARPGGSLTLNAGNAGTNNGNIDLGNTGGDVTINAGDSTGNGDPGGSIILRSGDAGANALAGQIQLIIPGGDVGAGGTWTFDGEGIIQLPNSGTIGNDGNNIDIGSTSAISLEASSAVNIYTDTGTNAWQWQFQDDGNLRLPTIELDVGNTINEQTVIQSQRKIIPGLRYSAEINGTTPTVVYTATSVDTTSMKVTMQIQHTGLGFEFFDVSATSTDGNTYYTVSNRLQPPTIADSTVVVDLNGSNTMDITVTINSGAANSWVTYDATEFGIAVD